MNGLRERKRERLRAEILLAAEELVGAQSLMGLRVADLARRLEISEATFFNYFPTKSCLLDAWLERELANAFADLASSDAPGRAPLRLAVRALAESARRASGLAAEAWRSARVQAAARSAPVLAGLEAALARAVERGELRRDVETSALARTIAAGVACAISSALAEERDAPADALAAVDLVLDGAQRRHERLRIGALAVAPSGDRARS